MNDKNKKIETIAEQWVNLVLAQIEAKKQTIKALAEQKTKKVK